MDDPKHKIRKGTLYNRRMLADEVWQQRNDRLINAAYSFLVQKQIQCFHVFLPIKRNNEVDTWPILTQSIENGKRVIVSATDFERQTMTHYGYSPDLVFEEDRFGIPTPRSGTVADLTELELIFIPLLAGDKAGNRIGYGKGYYDRLLAEMAPDLLKVGLTLSPLFDHFPFAEPHDISLDYCITPYEIVRCRE